MILGQPIYVETHISDNKSLNILVSIGFITQYFKLSDFQYAWFQILNSFGQLLFTLWSGKITAVCRFILPNGRDMVSNAYWKYSMWKCILSRHPLLCWLEHYPDVILIVS